MNFKKGTSFIWIIFGVFLAIGTIVIITRINTPEDNWICVNNEWIKHGNPTSTKPQGKCGDLITGANFVEKGNIVKSKENNGWVLVFEKPGAPALTTSLVFVSKSQCKIRSTLVSCEDEMWKQGAKVQVEGIVSGKKVNVLRLKIY